MSEIENKPYYKIGEVCELTGTQPYVLRFWESEFPTLAPEKNRSGQRVYRRRDIDLIQKIKALLYEKEYTIAGARKVLESEDSEISDGGTGGHGAGHAHGGSKSKRRERHEGDSAGPSAAEARASADLEPALPFRASAVADAQLEAELKNLRAKLARAEAELQALLAEMDRHDER